MSSLPDLAEALCRAAASRDFDYALRVAEQIASKLPEPRGPMRFKGVASRAGDTADMIPADPLAHSTPRFTGWSRLPSM